MEIPCVSANQRSCVQKHTTLFWERSVDGRKFFSINAFLSRKGFVFGSHSWAI